MRHFQGWILCRVLLLSEVYALVTGLGWWRRSLLLEVMTKQLGYVLDPTTNVCALLPSECTKSDAAEGFIIGEVDDLAEAGGPELDFSGRASRRLSSSIQSCIFIPKSNSCSSHCGERCRQTSEIVSYSVENPCNQGSKPQKLADC